MKRFALLLVISVFSTSAFATSPMFGATMSVVIAQQMLAAPPLPSLEGGERTIAPQYGYVSVKQAFTEPVPTGGTFNTTGGVSGNTAGLSLMIPTKGDWGFFLFALGSRITGKSDAFQDGVATYSITDVKSDTLAGAGGVSYRLIGDDDSILALGVYGGPAFIKISSSSKFTSSGNFGASSEAEFTFDPQFTGLYNGLQLSVRFGKLVVNPYLVMFQESGDRCQPISSTGTNTSNDASAFTCDGKTG
ncbi:MAG: hypothetical protein V4760_16110, partial [Bdellovibrionota bacterium]